MRCKTCDYRLWNLQSRRCPECGTPFRPSEYEFVPNSIQYCCPHCNEAYYGTGEKGHLVPAAFDCVSCGNHVHMDDMVLLPTEGLEEEQTKVYKAPWLERRERGTIKAWLATVGMAMVSPMRLMRGLPRHRSTAPAWGFAILTTILTTLVSVTPFGLVPMYFAATGVGGGTLQVLAVFGLAAVIVAASVLCATVLWGLAAHGLLRLTGSTAGGLGRTYQALCFSNGANVVSAVPCLGFYFGWIWWVVSAVLMLKERQDVSGGRAALAVAPFPLFSIGGLMGLYVWYLMAFLAAMPTTMPLAQLGNMETQFVLDAVREYADEHNGRGPGHAAELVAESYLSSSMLVSSGSATRESQVPVAETTLTQFGLEAESRARRTAQAALEALPEGTVAHRLGDFVFTYHGVDLESSDPGLWLMILSPDPDANPPPRPTATVFVGLADGTVLQFPVSQLPAELAEQNALRSQDGLPALPDPTSVTHAEPAVSEP